MVYLSVGTRGTSQVNGLAMYCKFRQRLGAPRSEGLRKVGLWMDNPGRHQVHVFTSLLGTQLPSDTLFSFVFGEPSTLSQPKQDALFMPWKSTGHLSFGRQLRNPKWETPRREDWLDFAWMSDSCPLPPVFLLWPRWNEMGWDDMGMPNNTSRGCFLILLNHRSFQQLAVFPGFLGFSRKKNPWKEWERYPGTLTGTHSKLVFGYQVPRGARLSGTK